MNNYLELQQMTVDLGQALKQADMTLDIVSSLPNTIIVTDKSGVIIWVNSAAIANYGYLPSELIGYNPRVLASGQHSKQFYQLMWTTILSGNTWQDWIINQRKDGILVKEWTTIFPVIREGNIKIFVGVKQMLPEGDILVAK